MTDDDTRRASGGGSADGALPQLERIETLLELDRLDQAEAELAAWSGADPDHPLVLAAWSRVHARRRRWPDAVDTASRVVADAPDEPVGYLLLGTAQRGGGRLREAAASFERLVELDPHEAHGHAQLAQVYSDLKRHQEAWAAGRRAVELAPHDADSHFAFGYAAQDVDPDVARQAYSTALEINPHDTTTRHNLAGLNVGRNDRVAAGDMARVLATDPTAALPLRAIDEMTATALARVHLFTLGALFLSVNAAAASSTPAPQLVGLAAVALAGWFSWRRLRSVTEAHPTGTLTWLSGYRRRDGLGTLWLGLLAATLVLCATGCLVALSGPTHGVPFVMTGFVLLLTGTITSWIRRFVQGRRIQRERLQL